MKICKLPLLAVLALSACVAEDLCDSPDRAVSGSISTPTPSGAVAGPITLSGTLDADVAVARIWAANANGEQVAVGSAKTGALNFDQWQIEIPAEALRPEPGESAATLDVFATDVCAAERGLDHLLDSFTVEVRPPDDTPVLELEAEVIFTGEDRCFLPADASAEATIRLRADQASVGGLVKLSASLVDFDEGPLDEGKLRLIAVDGGAGEDIGVFAAESKSGIATIRVSASGSDTQELEIVVAEGPRLLAGALALPAGGKTTVHVTSRGILDSCVAVTASNAASVSILGGGADLIAGPVPVGSKDCSDPTALDDAMLEVEFSNQATSDTLVLLRCIDTHGQLGNELAFTFLEQEP